MCVKVAGCCSVHHLVLCIVRRIYQSQSGMALGKERVFGVDSMSSNHFSFCAALIVHLTDRGKTQGRCASTLFSMGQGGRERYKME